MIVSKNCTLRLQQALARNRHLNVASVRAVSTNLPSTLMVSTRTTTGVPVIQRIHNKSNKSQCFHSSSLMQQSSQTVADKIESSFPNSYKGKDLVSKIQSILAQNGYNDEKTLFATSLCCDEVNRELESEFVNTYNFNFSMGGLAGFPFGGVTSFGAMAHHIPDDGSCLILYGPHVGIDLDGNVGKINRRGREGSGACCGSAAAAYGYVKSVTETNGDLASIPDDDLPALDAQQTFVGNMLMSQSSRLLDSNVVDANVELPLALFDVQDEFMKKIVEKGCVEVAGEGKIALLGGIQINTPDGNSEYFLPKVFEIRNNKGELVADLMGNL